MKSLKTKKRKRFSFKQKIVISICFFISFMIVSLIYLSNVVSPVILQASEAKVKSLAQSALSNAVFSIVTSEDDTYSKLLTYTYDNEGSIAMINVDSVCV